MARPDSGLPDSASARPALYLGLMSGSSLDGVDAVLCRFSPQFQLLGQHYLPMPPALRQQLLQLQSPSPNELHLAALAGVALSRFYAEAVATLLAQQGCPAEDIAAIGSHGQTLRHQPSLGYTLQIQDPALLAELSGIDVIADFRSRDIAAGGQGAPLVPAFHAALFRSPDEHRVILNLGGMANLTKLPPSGPVSGFDCGPGNVLLDAWIQASLGHDYDADGAWAASGKPIPALLAALLDHPFLALPPPKSCGREQFNLADLKSLLKPGWAAADVQASLLQFTALSAAAAIQRHCPAAQAVYLCGGGARNAALAQALATALPNCRIASTADLGLAIDAVEAAAFAWLAHAFHSGQCANLP
ncbi:MAG: hypothetical protein RIR00_2433, partial [Pseudomonadota bacterium]